MLACKSVRAGYPLVPPNLFFCVHVQIKISLDHCRLEKNQYCDALDHDPIPGMCIPENPGRHFPIPFFPVHSFSLDNQTPVFSTDARCYQQRMTEMMIEKICFTSNIVIFFNETFEANMLFCVSFRSISVLAS